MIPKDELPRRIRELRRLAEKSLRAMGEEMGVSHQTISQAENPNRQGVKIEELRVQLFERLAKVKVKRALYEYEPEGLSL